MKKIAFVLFVAFASCTKVGQFETVVKATPNNVAFSLNEKLPYHVTVQAEKADQNGQFVFSANSKKVFDTFKDAVKDTSFVLIEVSEGGIIKAEKIGK